MHFKLLIIKYFALSYHLILQLYIKQHNYTNFSQKTNSPTFCGQITKQYFNISADQFLLLVLTLQNQYIQGADDKAF